MTITREEDSDATYFTKLGILQSNEQLDLRKKKMKLLIPILTVSNDGENIVLWWHTAEGEELRQWPLCTKEEFVKKYGEEYKPRIFSVLFVGQADNWEPPKAAQCCTEEDEDEQSEYERLVANRYADMHRCLRGYSLTSPEREIAFVTCPIYKNNSSVFGVRKIFPLADAENLKPRPYSLVNADYRQEALQTRWHNKLLI